MAPVGSSWVTAALLVLAAGNDPLPAGALGRLEPAARGAIHALAVSADGRFVAAGSQDGGVHLWRTNTKKLERSRTLHEGAVRAIVFSPDGKLVASAGADRTIRLCRLASGETIRVLRGHRDTVEALAFAPDGKTLVSAGQDEAILLWEVATGEVMRRLTGHTRGVRSAAVSRDGATLASAGEDRTIHLWDFPGGTHRQTFKRPGWVFALAFSGDGRTLASGGLDQSLHVRKLRHPGEYDTFAGYDGPIESVAMFFDAKMIAAGTDDGKVRLWEWMTRSIRREFNGHQGIVRAVALSPDEKMLLSAGADGQVIVWDATGGSGLDRPLHTEADWRLAWDQLGAPPEEAFRAMGRLRANPSRLIDFASAQGTPLFKLSARLTELLRDLDSEKFALRRRATVELAEIGELAVPFLEQQLRKNLTLETRRRIEHIVGQATSSDPARHSTFLQWWRTIEMLEATHAASARQLLERIARDMPDARLRQEGQAALERLALR